MKFKVIPIIILTLSLFVGFKVLAAEGDAGTANCEAPYYIPNACKNVYIPGKVGGYTADLNCQIAKISDPSNKCCPNICLNKDGTVSKDTPAETNPEDFQSFEVFGTSIKVNPNNVSTIINILFTTALGLAALYALIRGIYVAGVKRPLANTPEAIAEVSQELTNIVIGLLITLGFIIVIQVIANLLGVGQLNKLDFSTNTGTLVVTIK